MNQNQQLAATKNNMLELKKKLKFSKRSFELLDKKQKILTQELFMIVERAKTLEKSLIKSFKKAFLLLKKSQLTVESCEEFSKLIPLETNVYTSIRSVMGVEIPVVAIDDSGDNKKLFSQRFGFLNTNSFFDETIHAFDELKRSIVEFSHIENMVFLLTEAIKKTKSRTNALEHIAIPRMERSLKSITKSLEEKEREVFSKLKLIKCK